MTPAVIALRAARVDHTLHEYAHDPRSDSFGLEAAAALGLDPDRVYKTLMANADGSLVVAVVPRVGGLLVAGWLAGIIVSLLLVGGYADIALRDFGLLLGALTLSRLASADRTMTASPASLH